MEICELEIEGISSVEGDTDFRKVNSTLAIREAEKTEPRRFRDLPHWYRWDKTESGVDPQED